MTKPNGPRDPGGDPPGAADSTSRLGETGRLLERARTGAPDALEAFYRRAARKLLPIIRLRLGPTLRRDAESGDILQAVLLRSFERLSQLDNPNAAMAWLATMAANEIRDRAQHQSRQKRDAARQVPIDDHAESVPAPVRQALSLAILSERVRQVEAALESLTPSQREIVVLRKLEELTFAEISARTGRSEDACRMAFARAMAALTLRLKGEPS
jgi:RNA polymerase sigma factor (sigma-70 family)